jgi:hypothetical protein
MTKLKILYISDAIPPHSASATLRNVALCRGLSEIGADLVILTQEPGRDFVNFDEKLNHYLPKGVPIRRTEYGKFYSRAIKKRTGTETPIVNNQPLIRALFRKLVKNLFFFPDINCEWISRIKRYEIETLALEEQDFIISSSDSKTSHYVARFLKNKTRCRAKWIQIWGDPWVGDIGLTGIHKFRARFSEPRLLKEADYVFYVSEPTLKRNRERYPFITGKSAFLGRSYLEEITRPEAMPFKGSEVRFLYTGVLDIAKRNISPLIEAIENLGTINGKSLSVDILGFVDRGTKETIDRKRATVRYHGYRTFRETSEEIRKADILFLIGNPDSDQIPGKLFDYLGTDLPILAILDKKDSEVGRYIRSLNRCFIAENTPDSLVETIREILANPGKYPLKPLAEFSPAATAKRLTGVLEKLGPGRIQR